MNSSIRLCGHPYIFTIFPRPAAPACAAFSPINIRTRIAVRPRAGRNWRPTTNPRWLDFRLFYGHLSANLADYLPDGVRTFTFLRSPVGRTISTIRHLMRDPSFNPMHERTKGRTLKEAIYDDELMLGLQNAQTTLLSCDVPIEDMLAHARRQIAANKFVEMGSLQWTSSLPKALRTLEGYDFVGLMDHFRESLWAMCAQFGFAPPGSHAGTQPRHR